MREQPDEENDGPEEGGLYEHYHLTADQGQSLIRVDQFLSNQLPGTSRSRVQAAAEAGCIRVNSTPVKSSYRVKPGDEVTVVMEYPRRETIIVAEDLPLDIVYEDEELLVVNKQAGMVVHPGHGNYSGTLVNALCWHLRDMPLFNADDPRPGLVHRIDKDTSGLIVVAKTEQARLNLSFQFFEKSTERQYLALVWGNPKNNTGTIEGNVGRSISNRQVYTVFPEGDHGKPAITHYKVAERFGYVTLVECRLETGRTHQIRVHMKYAGHPLFNDATYGGNQILRGTTFSKYRQFVKNCFEILPRQALHAKTLGFLHPATGKRMLFDSGLPDDMAQVIEKWRKYTANRESEREI